MKQVFNLKIEFPEGWKITSETLKAMLQPKVKFEILEIELIKGEI